MCLSTKGLSSLLGILAEDQTRTQSFETLCNKSHHCFKKEDKFKVGNSLLFLIQQQDILPHPTQRLTAVVLLHDLYRRDPIIITPFLSVFIQILSPADSNKTVGHKAEEYIDDLPKFTIQERNFLSQLITRNAKELLKKTAQHIINSNPDAYQPANISELKNALQVRESLLPMSVKSGISLVLSDPDNSATDINFDLENTKKMLHSLFSNKKFANGKSYSPEFVRLVPPVTPVEDEVHWINITDEYSFNVAYDKTTVNIETPDNEARLLMERALKGMLTQAQQHQLVNQLESDPQLIYRIGLTPKQFPELVENNPLIAIDVLLKLMQCKHITEYFSVLVNMEMSLHSMEVVNRLTTTVDLPKEFIHLYISNCITTCETIKDRYMQNRLVRLVCVFLQSLIRNKIINVQEIYIEVHSFCIEFSHFREAGVLYRLLKNLEINETGSASPPSPPLPSSPQTLQLQQSFSLQQPQLQPQQIGNQIQQTQSQQQSSSRSGRSKKKEAKK